MGTRRSLKRGLALTFGLLAIWSCTPSGGGADAPAGSANTSQGQRALEGRITLIDAAPVDLADPARPTVLIFASDFCTVCSEEAKELAELFREKGGPPQNVRLLTVLIGAFKTDVAPWVAAHGVTWPTGIDEGDPLFRTYCAVAQTPCVLTYNPATGSLRTRNGHFTVPEIEKETGTWTY